jgi:peptidyl-prolyl cis-trans isomerase C
VGSIAIEAAEFRRRAARVAALDWRELGAAWPEQRRRFLEQVLIPEALLTLAAERLPDASPPARDRVLARTLAAALSDEAARAVPSDADVRAYRARHEAEFGTPRSLGIWRILLATESEARAVISQLAPPTPDAFSRIARERSLDRATNMRAGNLGLVAADGQTAVPELRVSPALFAAAERVDDGALVPEPVREGDAFAVVWRRTSRAATALPATEVSATIAARLAEQRAAAAQDALLERLRREQLSEHHPERVSDYEPRFPAARDRAARSPVTPDSNRAPRLLPEPSDRGLR